jgi:hypothetical protein
MKNRGQQLSPKDIVELLAKAKELGVVELRLAGFETSFFPQEEAPADAPGPKGRWTRRNHPPGGPLCDDCGTAPKTLGRFGYLPLCDDCFRSQPPPAPRRPRYYYGGGRPWRGGGRGRW